MQQQLIHSCALKHAPHARHACAQAAAAVKGIPTASRSRRETWRSKVVWSGGAQLDGMAHLERSMHPRRRALCAGGRAGECLRIAHEVLRWRQNQAGGARCHGHGRDDLASEVPARRMYCMAPLCTRTVASSMVSLTFLFVRKASSSLPIALETCSGTLAYSPLIGPGRWWGGQLGEAGRQVRGWSGAGAGRARSSGIRPSVVARRHDSCA